MLDAIKEALVAWVEDEPQDGVRPRTAHGAQRAEREISVPQRQEGARFDSVAIGATDDLHVEVLGDGEPAVLVHGSGGRESAWSDQLALARRWRLVMPDRRGYGRSPRARPSFQLDAADICRLLGEGAHLVGLSYGAIGALLAAARRPHVVHSLTVIEPPAFHVASGHPAVAGFLRRAKPVLAAAGQLTPEEFDARLEAAVEGQEPPDPPPTLAPERWAAVEAMMRERPPWEAELPLAAFARVSFPTLVVSGGLNPAFEAVCDVLHTALGGERAILAGTQHAPEFNERLAAFWERAAG